MSGNIVAITFYNKPELLYIYLEQLVKSGVVNDFKIRLHTEEGYSDEEDYVIGQYRKYIKDLKVFVKKKYGQLTGFNNILSSYIMSAEEGCDYMIVGEEDILPTLDYLTFNSYCYKFLKKYERIMCVAHKRRPETELDGYGEVMIGDYQCTSPSCISSRAITKYLVPEITHELMMNPIDYYRNKYPNSRIAFNDHIHHDGFIERVMEKYKLFVLKPDAARSMHVGLSGVFCQGTPPQGTFEERLSQWRELIKDGDRLRSLSNRPGDLVVVDDKGPDWQYLILDTDRTKAKASSWWYDTKNEFKDYIDSV